jgi:hypothetical protein
VKDVRHKSNSLELWLSWEILIVISLIILSVHKPTNFKGAALPIIDSSEELDWVTWENTVKTRHCTLIWNSVPSVQNAVTRSRHGVRYLPNYITVLSMKFCGCVWKFHPYAGSIAWSYTYFCTWMLLSLSLWQDSPWEFVSIIYCPVGVSLLSYLHLIYRRMRCVCWSPGDYVALYRI